MALQPEWSPIHCRMRRMASILSKRIENLGKERSHSPTHTVEVWGCTHGHGWCYSAETLGLSRPLWETQLDQ